MLRKGTMGKCMAGVISIRGQGSVKNMLKKKLVLKEAKKSNRDEIIKNFNDFKMSSSN